MELLGSAALVTRNVHEALQETDTDGGVVIGIDDKYVVVTEEVAQRLEAERVAFAYVFDTDRGIITVPVN